MEIQPLNTYTSIYTSNCVAITSQLNEWSSAGFFESLFERMVHHSTGRGTIFTFGNGGSGMTASHFVGDLLKGANQKGHRFHANCLNDNLATLTSIANDISYDSVFSEQLPWNLCPEDTVIAVSGSGNSPNILKALEVAKKSGATVVGLSGFDGGKLKKVSDISVWIPSNHMGIVEDMHHLTLHMLAWAFIDSPVKSKP